jgi:hypothetical protein
MKKTLFVLLIASFLVSCSTVEPIKPLPTEERESTPTVLASSTVLPTITLTAMPMVTKIPTTSAQATIEAFGPLCIGSKDIYRIEVSPDGKWIAAACYAENGKEESPLQVTTIDRSHDWKIYYSDHIFSSYLEKLGLGLDRHDAVVPYHWSKDGRFLYAVVGSRLEGCCWVNGGRYVLLIRLNLETGEQVALLNTDYYSAYTFTSIFSDGDRYLLFTPPSNQPYDFAILDLQTWETQEVFLNPNKAVSAAYARFSPKENRLIFPIFYFEPNDENYYVDSIVVVDLTTREQDTLITGITPEKQLFPIRWIDDSHILLSNINPVYDESNQTERHWLLDINSRQVEETFQ